MQNIIIAKPYRFVAPKRSTLWWRLFRPLLPLPGTRAPRPDAVAALPWHAPGSDSPLFQRVLGIFSGQ